MFGNESSPAVAEEKLSLQGGDALLEKGFQLANFIISDRHMALEILINALSKLQKQRSREVKRGYWRKRFLKQKITRMVRSEGDTLQWLIYFESERYEKQQERAGKPAEHEMVIRYIKHLAQMTTAMSSFYVNVGINRLLRNYSTREVRDVYESVTQHFPNDQEYRRVKTALMRKLKLRFGDFLEMCTGQYGELRFETLRDQECWVEVVRECLEAFTPWSTDQVCKVLSRSGSRLGSLPRGLDGKAPRILAQDVIEVKRCHLLLHPACYSRITEALGLDSAESRLGVPRFFMNGGNSCAPSSGTPISARLTEQERREIDERLSVESQRCRRVKPKFLKVLVDGGECARLVNGQGSRRQGRIEEGANLIEIWTDYEGEDLLLATHWVEYTQFQGIAAAAATVGLGNGRELLLEIMPQPVRDDASYGVLSLQCRPASTFERIRECLMNHSFWLHEFPKYALLSSLLLGIGWSIAKVRTNQELSSQHRAFEQLKKELSQERAARVSNQKLESDQQAVETYLLVPDETPGGHGRGYSGKQEPVIASSAHGALVILELPTPRGLQTPYRAVLKPLLESREILAESFPKPAESLQAARLEFALPMSFVKAGQHYVVELHSINSAARAERICTFTFYVGHK